MNKYERHYNRVHKKYLRFKQMIIHCPCGGSFGLNELHGRKWRRYFVECEECHWCSKSKPTMRMAIRAWNKDMKNHDKWYSEHVGDCD